ncbi:vitelline membrane outer layer protein 1 homolog [Engystomops pustulosus]|uniref:vitelline membrane outer layer protein 1 homolog n=1 Tax=Engystomops pustulosus TaxID=76066 RepID=UPI003AFA2861
MLPVLLLLGTLQNLVEAETIISVPNGGPWGEWGPMDVCGPGYVGTGFDIKVQKYQDIFDDSSLNAVGIFCTKIGSKDVVKIIISTEGPHGSWTGPKWCPSGYITQFCLKVQPNSKWGNTGANNIKFMCSDGSVIEGEGLDIGEYGPWSGVCNRGVNGVKSRVLGDQGPWKDDVGLSDVQMRCVD